MGAGKPASTEAVVPEDGDSFVFGEELIGTVDCRGLVELPEDKNYSQEMSELNLNYRQICT